jgi:hypothetical protein
LRIDGLVQIHGITLLLDYGDDLSVSSEINCVVEHRQNAMGPRHGIAGSKMRTPCSAAGVGHLARAIGRLVGQLYVTGLTVGMGKQSRSNHKQRQSGGCAGGLYS